MITLLEYTGREGSYYKWKVTTDNNASTGSVGDQVWWGAGELLVVEYADDEALNELFHEIESIDDFVKITDKVRY